MKLRKSFLISLLISFIVLICAGLVAAVIVCSIPTSPFAEVIAFIRQNHGSPAVYTSNAFQVLSAACSQMDSEITPIVLAIGGVALGWRLAKRVDLREAIVSSLVAGLIFTLLTLSWDNYAVIHTERAQIESAGYGEVSHFDRYFWLWLVIWAVIYTLSYTAGSMGAYWSRKRMARGSSARRKASWPPQPRKAV